MSVKTVAASELSFRQEIRPSDRQVVRGIVESSRLFSPAEVQIALGYLEESLTRGAESGYHFLFAEKAGDVLGFACFGPIDGTVGSYDLFWIAVQNELRGQGIGKELLRRSEENVARLGGRLLYAETSARPQYEPTRRFYGNNSYRQVAVLEDFYAPGDDKIIYVKRIS